MRISRTTDEAGGKELIAIAGDYRESEQPWRELLVDLERHGPVRAPEPAVGDGAPGFWKARRQLYGAAREQRCWVHETANVLDKLAKSEQAKAKRRLPEISMAESREAAERAFDRFPEAYGPKFDKALACLEKGRVVRLTFYDFPAGLEQHIRSANPAGEQDVTTSRWIAPARRDRPRRRIQGPREVNRTRRLNPSSPTLGHSPRLARGFLGCSGVHPNG